MNCYACMRNYILMGEKEEVFFLPSAVHVNRGKMCVSDRTPEPPSLHLTGCVEF